MTTLTRSLPIFIVVPRVPITAEELRAYAGEPCPDYEQLCPVCQSYEEWNATGTITFSIERTKLLEP
jgi:hypothetical protein